MNVRVACLRGFYYLTNPWRRAYWRLVKPYTRGVKVIVRDKEKVLLVKINYGPKYWTFPGGRVEKAETFEQGAARELQEETGLAAENLTFVGQYQSEIEGKRDTVQCFLCNAWGQALRVDPLEVSEARWFSQQELPENRSPSVDKILGFL